MKISLHTSQNSSTDGDLSSEGALFVNVMTFNSLLGSLETKTNLLVPVVASLLCILGVLENTVLFKVGTFSLSTVSTLCSTALWWTEAGKAVAHLQ
jgi:hypothetical protein